MKLQYRIGKLELDNMELEQSKIVHESAMRGKDLTIQKLQLQVFLHLVARDYFRDGNSSWSFLLPSDTLKASFIRRA